MQCDAPLVPAARHSSWLARSIKLYLYLLWMPRVTFRFLAGNDRRRFP